MTIFDCERMRFDHCGLYSFCDYLGRQLVKKATDVTGGLGFYVPQSHEGHFGHATYLRQRSRHKFWLRASGATLWHSTYQLTHFMPRGVPVLQTVHDLNFLYEDVPTFKQREYRHRLECHLERAVAVVTISQFTRDELLRHVRVPNIPVHVVYNGCNHYEGTFSRPASVGRHPFLFSIGTLQPKKNFHVLPCLLAKTEYELYIAGRDYGYAAKILDEARQWGVSDRVHLMGTISEAEKHWMLKNCEAFLFPSIAEGFGLPVLEAMQYGRPVFLSTKTCLPEIGGQHAYYFSADDFDRCAMQQDFLSGLQHYAEHPEQSQLLISHAKAFSWEKAASEYINLYNIYNAHP